VRQWDSYLVPQNVYLVHLKKRLSHITGSFSHTNFSQGSVATRLRCGGMFGNHFNATFTQNLRVKEYLKSVNIRQRYKQKLET